MLSLFRCGTGDSNCIHIASTTVQPNETYSVVVSDENNFDAVLPMRLVNYITVSPSSCARHSAKEQLVMKRVWATAQLQDSPMQIYLAEGMHWADPVSA